MAEVDTSLYSGLIQKPIDPIERLGQLQSLQQITNSNVMQQQEIKARTAMGPIMQQSVDPSTGQVDYDKFVLGLSKNPDTAWLAPQVANEAVQRGLTQAQTLAAKAQAQGSLNELRGQSLADLVAKVRGGQDITSQDLMTNASNYILALGKAGIKSQGEVDNVINMLAKAPQDPKQLGQYVQGMYLNSLSTKDSSDKIYGTIAPVDTGLGTQLIQQSPVTGSSNVEFVPKLIDRADPITGQPQKVIIQPGGAQGANPAITVPTGLTPQRAAGLAKMADYRQDLNDSVEGINSLQQQFAEGAKLMKNFKPGGGTSFFSNLASIAQGLGMPSTTVDYISKGMNPDGTPANLGSQQAFQKLAVQWSTEVMRRLLQGGGKFTNTEFNAFQSSNPNLDTDPRAFEEMVKFISKMSKVKYAEQQALGSYLSDPNNDPLDWQAQWNKYLVNKGIVNYDLFNGPENGGAQPKPTVLPAKPKVK